MLSKNRLLLTLLGFLSFTSPAIAQSIIAAPDGINTTITHNGNTYTINGGTQSGTSLFHSFSQLGLSPNEIANFLSNPDIANIIGRVTGGNPSIIQGLLSITGGNSNLLLMNPAGIVFTQGASLNLPASFTATTADSIGFKGGNFNATGNVNLANLTSSPTSFNFGSTANGTIINAAQLNTTGNLALIGSNVINTGSITSTDGNITITAVPNSRSLRINQAGMVLGIEIAPPDTNSNITAADIPRLLNDPNLKSATGLEVGANGEVRLVGASHSIDAQGNVTLAGSVSGQQVYLAAANDINPIGSPEQLIRTQNGEASAPTVTRFATNLNAPNRTIIVDATVPQYNDILFGGERGTTTVAVAKNEDGIAKISQLLNTPGLSKVDELHILSEGNTGNFWLGKAFVSNENIAQYQQQIESWSSGLNVGAEILLYACLAAAGAKGESLLNGLAAYSGASVAGSTNVTGLGGDWVLERQIGNANAPLPIEAGVLGNYLDNLAIFTATNGNDAGAGSLRDAITQANGLAGTDEIRFAAGVKLVTLTSAQLDIGTTTGGLTIVGDAIEPGNVTVERGSGAPNFRIFNITGNNNVTMEALTIRNGNLQGVFVLGGGIRNNTGTLILNNSTVSGNTAQYGGGIYSQGTLTLTNSTVSGNTAQYSGGIYSLGTLTLTNSTVSGNTALNGGGGIVSFRGGTIVNSTITNNTIIDNIGFDGGGGIYALGNAPLNISNSIVAGNFDRSSGNRFPDVFTIDGGTINSDGNNIIGYKTGAVGTIGTGSDILLNSSDTSSIIKPLGNYGGSTQTHALVIGGAAIDAGDNSFATGTDQRGGERIVDGTVDIGAVELQGYTAVIAGTPQSTQVNTSFTNPLSIQLLPVKFNDRPVNDVTITFASPSSGASATLGSGTTVKTDANGFASNLVSANGIDGKYQVAVAAGNTQLGTFDLTNTPIPPTPEPTPEPTPVPTPIPTPIPTPTPAPQLIAPPESNTPPGAQKPVSAQLQVSLACTGVTNPRYLEALSAKLPEIAALMNGNGGTLSIPLDNPRGECSPSLLALPGNAAVLESSLRNAIGDRIGDAFRRDARVSTSASAGGLTVVVEVNGSRQPAFLEEESDRKFYLNEGGQLRVLSGTQTQEYIRQQWPNR